MPAVILLDINLAPGSGFPILRWLRDHGHLADEKIRVVMLTSSDRTEDVQQALKLGALSYLVKSPFPDTVTKLLAKFAIQ
jgi:DNA-binding response OmpR family regulator